MSKKNKKHERQAPPVVTGHDERPEKREGKNDSFGRGCEVPDGISGKWS